MNFYSLCERRIKLLRQHGFMEEAIQHSRFLKDIKEDLAFLNEFDESR